MKVLLDNNMPKMLRQLLRGHLVVHIFDLGWSRTPDEKLLPLAEAHAYDVLIANDKSMVNEQNNAKRKISLVVVQNNSRKELKRAYERVLHAVETSTSGSYEYLEWMQSSKR